MIALTRINGSPVLVNDDLILTIESTPDTMLSMANGEKIVVQEPQDEIVKRIVTFRRRIHFADVSARKPQE